MELGVGKLVSRFEAAIIFALFLYCVIGQMNHAVRCILDVVLSTTGSEISVLIPVGLQVSVDRGRKEETTDVKLSIFIQQRLLNILLYDVTASMAVNLLRLYQRLNVVEVTTDLDATASVGVLTRLDNPERVTILWILLESVVVAWVVKGLSKFVEFTIIFTFFNMIG